MGNCEGLNHEDVDSRYGEKEWKVVLFDKQCHLLRNIYNDSLEVQKWILDSDEDEKIYQWRYQQNMHFLPKIIHITKIPSPDTHLPMTYSIITPVIQPLTKVVHHFNHQEYIFMMRVVFEAISLLSYKFGYFIVDEKNVFFNQNGQVKIWIHSNLAANHVEKTVNNNTSEQQYVETIFNLLQKHSPNQFLKINSQKMKIKQALLFLQQTLQQKYPFFERKIDMNKQYKLRANYSNKNEILTLQPSLNSHKINFADQQLINSNTTIAIKNKLTSNQYLHNYNDVKKQIVKENKPKEVDPDVLLDELIKSEKIVF